MGIMSVITQLLQNVGANRFALRQHHAPKQALHRLDQTLAGTPVGQPMRLVAVRADHKVVHRLAELGFTPGVTVAIVQATGGSFLVAVRGARLAIGRELAEQMEVAPLD